MKKFFASVFAIIVVASACAQKPPRLIVRGDDMGFSHSGNEALIKCFTEGIETSIEVLVPSPWFPEAVKMLEQNPKVDVGIHLALTSEWDNVKWRPLSRVKSLIEDDGYFYPFIWPNKNYPGRALLETRWTLEDVEKEFRAQIELALKKIPRLTHISGHMGCTHMDKKVIELVKGLAEEFHLKFEIERFGVKNIGLEGPRATSEEKIQSFIKMLDGLKAGETYVFVEHPGIDTPELRAVSHIGYENVAIDRQGVTDMFTDNRVKEAIKAKGIQLISYADVK